jgi:CHAD domain-containing protein
LTDVDRALRRLRQRPPSGRSVHEARKSLKRARAVLKLGRGTAVEAECARADAACRRAARALAPLRDEHVFAVTLENILERAADDLPREARACGRGLVLRSRRTEARALAGGVAYGRAKEALLSCPRGLGPAFARTVRATFEGGLRRSYRRARRAYRDASSSPGKERFHTLRTAAKRLLHELERLTPRALGPRAVLIASLRRLTAVLGDENDLALLRLRLGRPPDGGASADIRRYARKRQRRLRRRALILAKGLFSAADKVLL